MRLIAIGKDALPTQKIPMSPTIDEVCAATAQMYQAQEFITPWVGYLAQKDEKIVGTCAFKSAPQNQRVEIAYFTFPEYEGRGIATEMVSQLIAIARTELPGITICAQTLPQESASTSVVSKLGFRCLGIVNHPEDGAVWQWELS